MEKVALWDEFSDGSPQGMRWFEHPRFGSEADVVVLPLSQNTQFTQLQVPTADWSAVMVMSEVAIVGHPLETAVRPNEFPIYKRGWIASELSLIHI